MRFIRNLWRGATLGMAAKVIVAEPWYVYWLVFLGLVLIDTALDSLVENYR